MKYLARYTHRVAISNARLVEIDHQHVRFRYRDCMEGNRHGTMTVTGVEFVRRLSLHVLPKGFARIRHFGILANRNRRSHLALCRELLAAQEQPPTDAPDSPPDTTDLRAPRDGDPCPACEQGVGRCVDVLDRIRRTWLDTS